MLYDVTEPDCGVAMEAKNHPAKIYFFVMPNVNKNYFKSQNNFERFLLIKIWNP
jgi:hypothetical protein